MANVLYNPEKCGIGVINTSQSAINVGLYFLGIQFKYEHKVGPGGIFYRWPGLVPWAITVYVYNLSTDATMRHCYAGDDGTWLKVEDYVDNGGRLRLVTSTKDEVFRLGRFTEYSHARYHTIPSLRCTEYCQLCRRNDIVPNGDPRA
jgi:hypothetical protein